MDKEPPSPPAQMPFTGAADASNQLMKRKLTNLFQFFEGQLDALRDLLHVKPKEEEEEQQQQPKEYHYTKSKVAELNRRIVQLETAALDRKKVMPKLQHTPDKKEYTQESLDMVGKFLDQVVPALEKYTQFMSSTAKADVEDDEAVAAAACESQGNFQLALIPPTHSTTHHNNDKEEEETEEEEEEEETKPKRKRGPAKGHSTKRVKKSVSEK